MTTWISREFKVAITSKIDWHFNEVMHGYFGFIYERMLFSLLINLKFYKCITSKKVQLQACVGQFYYEFHSDCFHNIHIISDKSKILRYFSSILALTINYLYECQVSTSMLVMNVLLLKVICHFNLRICYMTDL